MTAADRQVTISVVIPSYNHEGYVREAIESAASQEGARVELIVVDDGSSDGSAAEIEATLGDVPTRSEFIRQENRGAHAALNRGLENATGEFVAILNSDDRYRPGRLQRLCQVLEERKAELAFSGARLIGATGQALPPLHPKALWYRSACQVMLSEASIGFGLLRINAALTSSNFVFRRRMFERIGGFSEERLCHDWTFLLRALSYSEPAYVGEALLDYRVHGGNTVDRIGCLREAEGEPALRSYLDRVVETPPENDCAPSPYWWPGYFEWFAAKRRPWFSSKPIEGYLPAKTTARGSDLTVPPCWAYRRANDALGSELRERDSWEKGLRERFGRLLPQSVGGARAAAWFQLARLCASESGRAARSGYIFGAGMGGRRALALLGSDWPVKGFIDNDRSLQTSEGLGGVVYGPEVLESSDAELVWVASMHADEIGAQLWDLGVEPQRVMPIDKALLAGDESRDWEPLRIVLLSDCERGGSFRERLSELGQVLECGLERVGEEGGWEFPRELDVGRSGSMELDCVVVARRDPWPAIRELKRWGLDSSKLFVASAAGR